MKVYTLRTFREVPSRHPSKAARDVSPSKTSLSKKPGNPNDIPMLSGTRPFWSAVDEGQLQTAYLLQVLTSETIPPATGGHGRQRRGQVGRAVHPQQTRWKRQVTSGGGGCKAGRLATISMLEKVLKTEGSRL